MSSMDERAGDGHHEDVAVLALRAAQVRVAEAQDAAVGPVAEARCAAVERLHIRADLEHTEGERRADEGVATPVDAEKWIDAVDEVGSANRGLGLQRGAGGHQDEGREKTSSGGRDKVRHGGLSSPTGMDCVDPGLFVRMRCGIGVGERVKERSSGRDLWVFVRCGDGEDADVVVVRQR